MANKSSRETLMVNWDAKALFTLLQITFDTDQKLIRSSVEKALKCQLYIVRITFDPFAKKIKSDTVDSSSFATDC